MEKNKKIACKILVFTFLFSMSMGASVQAQGGNFPFSKNFASDVRDEDVSHLKEYLSVDDFYALTRNFINSLLSVEAEQLALFGIHSQSKLYTIGGTITGTTGQIILKNNEETLTVMTANSSHFQFRKKLSRGKSYNVKVVQSPYGQDCSVVSGASGVIANTNIADIRIVCKKNLNSPVTYSVPGGGIPSSVRVIHTKTVGGTVSGLTGSVVLQNNGEDNLTISENGSFTFETAVAEGSTYNVTVLTQPETQTCTVNNGSGTMGGSNVTNVSVTCATNAYTVGGTVSGLTGSVVLQDNGEDNLTISENGSFTFSTPVAEGSTYNVTVLTQPETQTCTVNNGSGTMGGSNVTNVSVTCATNAYTVGGTVSGLTGSVVLQDNGGDNLTISENGSFTFSTPVAEGSTYNVTVLTQPETQTCTVNNGSGTMGGSNVTNVSVTCATNTYTVGGTISGLTNSVFLQNNDGDTLTVNFNGSFTFSTPVLDGSPYNVTIFTQPLGQICIVGNGSGTISGNNITGVTITCAPINLFEA